MAIVDASKLRKELAQAWGDVGRQEPDAGSGVLRACSMTLLVLTDDSDDPQALGSTLAELNHEFPSRTIVLRLHEQEQGIMDSRVAVTCWRPVGRRQQICSEQVELLASTGNLAELQSIILGLIVPDLPVVLWCRRTELLSGLLLELPHKVIVDGARNESIVEALRVQHLLAGRKFAFGDLAWTRVTRWREILYQLLEGPCSAGKSGAVRRVEVHYAGDTIPATACYLGAWLYRSLPGPPELHFSARPEADLNPAIGRIREVILSGDGINVTLTRPAGVGLDVKAEGISSRLLFPLLSQDDLIREEIAIFGSDSVFEETLRAVPEVLERAS